MIANIAALMIALVLLFCVVHTSSSAPLTSKIVMECSPGHYLALGPTSQCQPCPAGTYTPLSGVMRSSLCLSCPRGTISDGGSPTCTRCALGTVSVRGEKCVSCEPGYFVSRKDDCRKCPEGTFSDTHNAMSCTHCGPGMASARGDLACVPAKECPPGEAKTGSVAWSCRTCHDNHFRSASMEHCAPCAPRRATNEAQSRCAPCPPGQFLAAAFDSEFTRSCEVCPPGETTNGISKPFCRACGAKCPRGFFVDADGDCNRCMIDEVRDIAARVCRPCRGQTHSYGGWAKRCTKCLPGQKVTEHWAEWRCHCEPGHVVRDGRCVPCPRGTEKVSEHRCIICGADSHAPNLGTDSCIPCNSDNMSSVPSSGLRCETLPSCSNGYIRTKDYDACVSALTGCPKATRYTVLHSRSHCVDEGTGAVVCPVGTVFDNRWNCLRCGKGKYVSRRSDGRLECERCGGQFFSVGGVSRECTRCPDGFLGTQDSCVCPATMIVAPSGRCVNCYGYAPFGAPQDCIIPNFMYPQPDEV